MKKTLLLITVSIIFSCSKKEDQYIGTWVHERDRGDMIINDTIEFYKNGEQTILKDGRHEIAVSHKEDGSLILDAGFIKRSAFIDEKTGELSYPGKGMSMKNVRFKKVK